METEVAIQERNQPLNIIQVIEKAALDPNVDIDKMERLLAMHERILSKESELSFSRDMAACQAAMPSVVRDAVNPQTNSRYAKFETIINTIKPTYTEHGFSISYGTDESPADDHVRITAELMHRSGCSKPFFVDLPIDLAGIKGNANKTHIHATGSTHSYGKRYLISMIFNIAIADQDDDAVVAGALTIEKLLNHNNAIRDILPSICGIKQALLDEDYSAAVEGWNELSDEEKSSTWLAPTKGGMFTTEERKQMKSNEWAAALKDMAAS